MLNAKALSELLSRNSDERLFKRWLLMTPNGTLMAYTQPADAKELRKQAAVTALTWQQQQTSLQENPAGVDGRASPAASDRELFTLTIESETSNVIIRQIQSQLLLVLEGGVPPRRRTFEPRITAESPDGEHYLLSDVKTHISGLQTAPSSVAGSTKSTAAASVLEMQRKKLEAMASAITADFHQTGFQMPDESTNKFF